MYGKDASRSLLFWTTQTKQAEQKDNYDSEAVLKLTIVDFFGQEWKTEKKSRLRGEGGHVEFC
jgi:hypothetical protein